MGGRGCDDIVSDTEGRYPKVTTPAVDMTAAVSPHFLQLQLRSGLPPGSPLAPHQTLADPYPRTPAVAAGKADHVWTLAEIAGLLD
jgi:hypothetical protein